MYCFDVSSGALKHAIKLHKKEVLGAAHYDLYPHRRLRLLSLPLTNVLPHPHLISARGDICVRLRACSQAWPTTPTGISSPATLTTVLQ